MKKVRADTPGLVVIDASTAMQGQGPSIHLGGQLIKTQPIIAGTNPLAADKAAANVMRFQPKEISTFIWVWKAGLTPLRLENIEIRGKKIIEVKRPFMRPAVVPWAAIRQYGPPCWRPSINDQWAYFCMDNHGWVLHSAWRRHKVNNTDCL